MMKYDCSDPRQYIHQAGQDPAALTYSQCMWRKTFTVDVGELECRVHHCSHPHLHPGSHQPPPMENQLALASPYSAWSLATWHSPYVTFGSTITYTCPLNQYFELPEPSVVTPVRRTLAVECLDNGTYAIPPLQGNLWPNCTATVKCGQPPAKPSNGFINGQSGYDGTITWLNNAEDLQDTYDTWVEYRCVNGSMFDVNGDGDGDEETQRSRCQWDKTWSLPSLPACIITHCILPFPLPPDTALEVVTNAWTEVGQEKEYLCQNMTDGVHTMFWESDRTKSEFSMTCQADGTYKFTDSRANWPTCLTGGK